MGKNGSEVLRGEERRGEERRELRLPDQLYTDDLLLCGESEVNLRVVNGLGHI